MTGRSAWCQTSGASSPARTSGSTSAMKPLAWQPGFAMRFDAAMRARRPASSGKPYSQPSAVRCAVDVSITTVSGFSTRPTASIAAASGRHKNATSAALSASRRAATSLRTSSASVMTSTSDRDASRSRMRRPVVPADPSIKTFFMADSIPNLADFVRVTSPAFVQ